MPLKFISASGSGSTSDAIDAIMYAHSNGAQVISNSWGGPSYSQALVEALALASDDGVFIASAAGNDSQNIDFQPIYPGSYDVPNMLTVAASTGSWLASFSNYGPNSVHISAPGVRLLSTHVDAEFAQLSGTSMATPFVAGTAALMRYENETLTGYEVRELILERSDPTTEFSGQVEGNRRINVVNSILGAQGKTSQDLQPRYNTQGASRTLSSEEDIQGGCGSITQGPMPPPQGPQGVLLMILFLMPLMTAFGLRGPKTSFRL
jgi:subtilisin family serine protease